MEASVDREPPFVRFQEQVRQGIAEFAHMEVSGCLVLLVATIAALILANSPLAESYARFWKTEVGFRIGPFEFHETLIHWINDFFLVSPISLGIIALLVIGKQVGVMLFAFLTVKLGLAELPAGLSWKHICGAGWLAGVGFTMSLFIASLALQDAHLSAQAKLAILLASLIAGTGGLPLPPLLQHPPPE